MTDTGRLRGVPCANAAGSMYVALSSIPSSGLKDTVKPLYNVILYNSIFTIQHEFAGNGSISIKITSLLQNIHLMTPTVSSGNRHTFSIENIFFITEFLPCVSQFGNQDMVCCMKVLLSHLLRGKLLEF